METELICFNIGSKIYELRSQIVMLDFDLAELYNHISSLVGVIHSVTTSNLNKAVNRNIERFPPDFMFQLTNMEIKALKEGKDIPIQQKSTHGGRRSLPFAFTKEGIAMLSGLLNSARAIRVNIEIMRAFVTMQKDSSLQHHWFSKRIDRLEDLFIRADNYSERLLKIEEYLFQGNRQVNVEFKEAVQERSFSHSPKIQTIQSSVAGYFFISVKDLKGTRRKKTFILPRHCKSVWARSFHSFVCVPQNPKIAGVRYPGAKGC